MRAQINSYINIGSRGLRVTQVTAALITADSAIARAVTHPVPGGCLFTTSPDILADLVKIAGLVDAPGAKGYRTVDGRPC